MRKRQNNIDQKIYSYMACMSGNDKYPSESVGDSFQYTNWILDSGATCHILPVILDIIPGSIKYKDKHNKFADRHHVTANKKKSTNKNVRQ